MITLVTLPFRLLFWIVKLPLRLVWFAVKTVLMVLWLVPKTALRLVLLVVSLPFRTLRFIGFGGVLALAFGLAVGFFVGSGRAPGEAS